MPDRIVQLLIFAQTASISSLRIHGLDMDIRTVRSHYSALRKKNIRIALRKLERMVAAFGEVSDAYLFNLLWDTSIAAQRHIHHNSGIYFQQEGGMK